MKKGNQANQENRGNNSQNQQVPQQNVNEQPNPQQVWAQQLKKAYKTSTGLKYSIAILVGLLPMMMFSFMFHTDIGDNEPWVNYVSYGVTWGIAIGVYAFSIIAAIFLVKYIKDFKVDIISAVSQMAMIMLIFYITPQWELWAQFLMALPAAIFAQIFTSIFVFISVFTKQAKNMREGVQGFQSIFKKPDEKDLDEMMSKLDESLMNQGIDVKDLDNKHKAFDDQHKKSTEKKEKSNSKEIEAEVEIIQKKPNNSVSKNKKKKK